MDNNYLTYLNWRGDLSFEDFPFNEIDNLIFSELVYFNFDTIVFHDNQKITIIQAYKKLKQKYEKEKKAGIFSPSISTLQKIAESPRFQNLYLSNFIEKYDEEKMQFAAIKIEINDSLNYISFRGTDDTLAGWKEDFSISFEIVPSQKEATSYLNQVLDQDKQNIVGGHSKGGNLAIYGAMMCDDQLKNCITTIYSNDGPGLCKELIDTKKYQLIKDKIIKIIPEFSVVGLLFEKKDFSQLNIVKSSGKGILQHQLSSWQTDCQSLVKGKISSRAKVCNVIFNEWVEDVCMEDRKIFVDDFFDALSINGARTLADLSNQGPNSFEEILNSMIHSQKKSKLVFIKLIKSIFNRIKNIDYFQLFKEKEFLFPFFSFFIGLIFLISPHLAQTIIGTIIFIILLCYSLYQLYHVKKDFNKDKQSSQCKFIFFGAIVIIEIFCIIQNKIIIFSINMILGIILLYRSYREMNKAMIYKYEKKKSWFIIFINSLFACLLGIVSLTSKSNIRVEYVIVAGSYLILNGIVELIKVFDNHALISLRKPTSK